MLLVYKIKVIYGYLAEFVFNFQEEILVDIFSTSNFSRPTTIEILKKMTKKSSNKHSIKTIF